MIVDFHTHIFPQRIKDNREQYASKDSAFSQLYSKSSARIATVNDLLASMDKAAIDISVALNFGWQSHDLCIETNDYIIEALGRYPERIIGFCSIQPSAGEKALRELERCHQNGIRGIGEVRLDEQNIDPTDKVFVGPFIKLAESLGMIMLIHASEPVGHSYPGKSVTNLTKLYYLIETYPKLKVVLAHWGGGMPFYSLMPEVAKALENTYFDTAATQLLYNNHIFQFVGQVVSPEKILFASDFPLISQRGTLDLIKSLAISVEHQSLILGKNAERLLGLMEPDLEITKPVYEGLHSN